MILCLSDHFDGLHTLFDRGLVKRNEVCVSCRDAFRESFVDVLGFHDRLHLEERSHNRHIVNLRIADLCRNVDCIDLADPDVCPCRRVDDSVRIINEKTARLYSILELVK